MKDKRTKEQYSKEQYKKDNTFIIDVAKDFSTLPHGRYHRDSPDCAEALMIMIHDVLDYHKWVEVRFDNLAIVAVGSSFLEHLAQMIVVNHCSECVTVTSDDDWVMSRWDKYFNSYYDKLNRGEL